MGEIIRGGRAILQRFARRAERQKAAGGQLQLPVHVIADRQHLFPARGNVPEERPCPLRQFALGTVAARQQEGNDVSRKIGRRLWASNGVAALREATAEDDTLALDAEAAGQRLIAAQQIAILVQVDRLHLDAPAVGQRSCRDFLGLRDVAPLGGMDIEDGGDHRCVGLFEFKTVAVANMHVSTPGRACATGPETIMCSRTAGSKRPATELDRKARCSGTSASP